MGRLGRRLGRSVDLARLCGAVTTSDVRAHVSRRQRDRQSQCTEHGFGVLLLTDPGAQNKLRALALGLVESGVFERPELRDSELGQFPSGDRCLDPLAPPLRRWKAVALCRLVLIKNGFDDIAEHKSRAHLWVGQSR